MVNTIYKKVKQIMHEEWKFILVLLLITFVTLYPVDCYIITGGGTISATERVKIKGANKKKGSFNLAYVSELKGTVYTYLLSYIIPTYERESISDYKYDETESDEVINFRNNLLLKSANNNAIYVAYTNASKKIEVKKNSLYVYYVQKEADTDLEVGDEILKVDGKKVSSYDDLLNSLQDIPKNSVISIEVKSKNKIKTKTAKLFEKKGKVYIGINVMEDTSYKLDPNVSLKFKKSEGGPSGGLMMSLEIYSQLINRDITGGKVIVGTGTIDKDGTVGEIDGVKFKLRGAVKKHADIFIVPTGENYQEALKEKKKNNYDIKIIEAKTFKQVVEKLY